VRCGLGEGGLRRELAWCTEGGMVGGITVSGTLPVRRRLRIAKAIRVIPSERERYSSSAVDSRTSGERSVMITVGERISGMASSVIHAADTLIG